MSAVTAEVEARKKPRPARPETDERATTAPRPGNGAAAGMPLFLYPPTAEGPARSNGHGEAQSAQPRSGESHEKTAPRTAPTAPARSNGHEAQSAVQPPAAAQPPAAPAPEIATPPPASAPPVEAEISRPPAPTAAEAGTAPSSSEAVRRPPTAPPLALPPLPGAAPSQVGAPPEAAAPITPAAETSRLPALSENAVGGPATRAPAAASAITPLAGGPTAAAQVLAAGSAGGKPAGTAKGAKEPAAAGAQAAEEKKPGAASGPETSAVAKGAAKPGWAETGAVTPAEAAGPAGAAAKPEDLAKTAAPSAEAGLPAAGPAGPGAESGGGAAPAEAAPGEEGGDGEAAGAAVTEQRMAAAAGEQETTPEGVEGSETAADEEPPTETAASDEEAGAGEILGGAAGSATEDMATAEGGAGAAPSAAEAEVHDAETAANEAATEEREATAEAEQEAPAPGVPSAPELAAAGGPGTAAEPAAAPVAAEAAPDDSSEAAAGAAESAELSPAEQGAAMSALAEGGGGEAEPAGGGGGGGAIPDQPVPEAPDVSAAEPAQALGAISSLPPVPMAQALGGVNAAVSRTVGEQRADLAANPPQMERPSGSPRSKSGSTAGAGEDASGEALARPERAAAGQPAPTPEPEPLSSAPPPPAGSAIAPDVAGNEKGEMSGADASRMASSIGSIPTGDPALDATAGPPPTLRLEGDANPAQTQQQRARIERSVTATQARGRRDAAAPLGESDIYPVVPPETLQATIPTGGNGRAAGKGMGAAAAVGDDAVSIVAQQESGAEIQAAVGKAQGDMAAERAAHESKVAEEKSNTQQEIARTEAENTAEQADARRTAQADVQAARRDWTEEQQQIVGEGRAAADGEMSQGEEEIASERAKGEKEAGEHVAKGNADAAAAKREGEEKAESERQRGEKESDGFFGWLASKAKAFFDAIKNAIKAALDAARKAIKAAIELAKKLAVAAIEAARKAVVAVIKKVGDALIAIGDRVLGAFPGLRNRWRSFIKSKVAAAEAAVNRLAEKLKEGVKKALDLLGKALDAALGLLEKGLMAAVDFVGGVVQGAIKAAKAIVDAIGTFAVLIKDIASAPGRWISNLGKAIVDGIKNHLWKAFKTAIKNWFNQKLEEVVGLGMTIWNVLTKGGIKLAEIGSMVWEALKAAIPMALVQILVEKLVSMIVPAAGAVLAIIEGIQAAWGTISRILQAISRFIAFLKAVKSGNAGPQFADALAAAAIAVIDFVANWLLKRLRKGASKVAGKIKAIAQRIMGKIKKAAKKVGQKLKRAGQKVAAKLKQLGGKIKGKWEQFKAKRKKGKPGKEKPKREKKSKEERMRERLGKAVRALRPKIEGLLRRGTSGILLRARLLSWRVFYRLSKLELIGQGDSARVLATVNPSEDIVRDIVQKHGPLLLAMIREIGRDILKDPTVREHLMHIREQRASGAGKDPGSPLIHSPGIVGLHAQAADVAAFGKPPPTFTPPPGVIRQPWSTEYSQVGGVPVTERQTWSSQPGHIRVERVGRYDEIAGMWNQIRASTGSSDSEMAAALRIFTQTGHLDPKFAGARMQLAALTRLSAVEMGRSSAQVVTGPMAMSLVESGKLTGPQALQELNPMAPTAAVHTASGVSERLGMEPERDYKTPASPARMASMVETELELMTKFLYSKMQIEQPLFKTAQDLERFIRKELRSYLNNEVRVTLLAGGGQE